MSESTETIVNEETQGLLTSAGAEILEWLRATGDLVTEQAPLVAQEVVARGFVHEFVTAAWCFGWAVAGIILIRYAGSWFRTAGDITAEKGDRYRRDEEIPYQTGAVVGWVCGGFAILVGSVEAFLSLRTALEIYVAPKVYVIEQLSNLVN